MCIFYRFVFANESTLLVRVYRPKVLHKTNTLSGHCSAQRIYFVARTGQPRSNDNTITFGHTYSRGIHHKFIRPAIRFAQNLKSIENCAHTCATAMRNVILYTHRNTAHVLFPSSGRRKSTGARAFRKSICSCPHLCTGVHTCTGVVTWNSIHL